MAPEKKRDIYDRAFNFAVKTAKFLESLPRTTAIIEYKTQLIRSSASIGANIAEADGALTRKDFINKLGIARREARESGHWLKLIEAVLTVLEKSSRDELAWLIKESTELMLILSSIIKKTQDKED